MLSAPEDYGLSEAETYGHRLEAGAPSGFEAYWRAFREEIAAVPDRWQGRIDSAQNQVIVESMRNVRVVARVGMPAQPPRAVVLTAHGYEIPDGDISGDDDHWTGAGIAIIRLRVRGYPPSTLDLPDLRGDWILHNITSPSDWILRGAVGDVISLYRAARRHFGVEMPICLDGESFGGGLAVIAAAQLDAMSDPPSRLVVGLPTFGDWRWRRGHYSNGLGGQVNMLLESLREDADQVLDSLLLFDSALHARAVRVPTLAKLAARDDAVPAPTAAAVYNAIASDEKWMWPVAYGHFDGGLVDLRRHARFEAMRRAFVDPALPPAEAAQPAEG